MTNTLTVSETGAKELPIYFTLTWKSISDLEIPVPDIVSARRGFIQLIANQENKLADLTFEVLPEPKDLYLTEDDDKPYGKSALNIILTNSDSHLNQDGTNFKIREYNQDCIFNGAGFESHHISMALNNIRAMPNYTVEKEDAFLSFIAPVE